MYRIKIKVIGWTFHNQIWTDFILSFPGSSLNYQVLTSFYKLLQDNQMLECAKRVEIDYLTGDSVDYCVSSLSQLIRSSG